VRFRTVSLQGRKCHAYDLFSANQAFFCALLEDPSECGRQYLVSQAGERHMLSDLTDAMADGFLDTWKAQLNQDEKHASPCIRQLFYAAYEAANLIEALPPPDNQPPACILWTLLPEFSLCVDNAQSCVHLAAHSEAQLDDLEAMVVSPDGASGDVLKAFDVQSITCTTADTLYKQNVDRVRDYIAAGDVFQANIARFWQASFAEHDLLPLYSRLRKVNAAPFSCFVRIETNQDTLTILSASPERLFRITPDGMVDTRPIAGTRRRGEGEMDAQLREEMLLSEKERAEHIMLVDLERNDLGRVCVAGSVEVNERMAVEAYATVQHIVSNVRGKLRAELGLVDVFRAMFPGGTITGCPKVRCMEIIHALEGQTRGPYTGGVGFLAWDGSADMNILIRTFWHHQEHLNWAAGAGIVADSDPEFELHETGLKAEGLLRALL